MEPLEHTSDERGQETVRAVAATLAAVRARIERSCAAAGRSADSVSILAVTKGFGPEAIRILARYLIDVRGHHRLTIDPAADNVNAIKAYERIGFRPVGRMRSYERGTDGTWHDGLLMDMLAEELRD